MRTVGFGYENRDIQAQVASQPTKTTNPGFSKEGTSIGPLVFKDVAKFININNLYGN